METHMDWTCSPPTYSYSAELLKYGIGGHFEYHKDRVLERHELTHTHVALIYPYISNSLNQNSYKGGDFIIGKGISQMTTETSKATSNMIIILDINTYHKISHVTEGERYVFKIPLYRIDSNYIGDDCFESYMF